MNRVQSTLMHVNMLAVYAVYLFFVPDFELMKILSIPTTAHFLFLVTFTFQILIAVYVTSERFKLAYHHKDRLVLTALFLVINGFAFMTIPVAINPEVTSYISWIGLSMFGIGSIAYMLVLQNHVKTNQDN